MKINNKEKILFLVLLIGSLLFSAPSESAEVIILGDAQLKPVVDVVAAIESVLLPSRTSLYLPSQLNGRLQNIVNEEHVSVVVALGKDAMDVAAALPESVPVVYGMLITPPRVQRQNMTGILMETPVDEYIAFVQKNFPQIRRVGAVCSQDTERMARSAASQHIKTAKVKNSYEFVNAVKSIDADALLLLPDRRLLTPAALDEAYLFSFQNKIPVLGISERHVKEGSLFALVFDTSGMGRQLGEMVKAVIANGSADTIAPALPRKFNLYINTDTARKMNITVPDEVLRKARKVYP